MIKIVGVLAKLTAVIVAVTLFVTQTANKGAVANRFDVVEAKLAERPTKAQVIEMIQGPANQYVMDQDMIMSVVGDYRADIRKLEERLGTIQTDIARLVTLIEIRSGPQKARK